MSYEQKWNKNSLSTISTLRTKIDKMQHQLDQKDEALYTKDQSFEVNEQLLRRKVKSEAAFVCNICIMSIKRSSLRRALDTWQRVVFESNIKWIHEYTVQELEAQSEAVEHMQLEAQKKQGEKELNLKNWENSSKKKKKELGNR